MDRAGLGRRKRDVVARASGSVPVSWTQEKSQVENPRLCLPSCLA